MELFNHFILAFVPLFVAIDVIGILPIYLSLTGGYTKAERQRLLNQACFTGLVVSLLFMLAGRLVLRLMGITTNDFRIAGGLILLIMAIADLLFSQQEQRRTPDDSIGVVPLGTPLIIGPAALTTILMSLENHGLPPTLISILVNLFIVWIVFARAEWILAKVGAPITRATAKVAALFLAAIGVMMIRIGIIGQFPIP